MSLRATNQGKDSRSRATAGRRLLPAGAAGGSVTVNEVRSDDQVLTDTALLTSADPSQPFSVTYSVAGLTQSTGELAPAALGSASGTQLAAKLLGLPNMPTGTTVVNN